MIVSGDIYSLYIFSLLYEDCVILISGIVVVCQQEGIKLLNTWLEGERSYNFCKFIGLNTAKLRPDEIPHSKIRF